LRKSIIKFFVGLILELRNLSVMVSLKIEVHSRQ